MKQKVILATVAIFLAALGFVLLWRPGGNSTSNSGTATTTPSKDAVPKTGVATTAITTSNTSLVDAPLDDVSLEALRKEAVVDDVHRIRIKGRIQTLQTESLDKLKETIYEEAWYEDPGVLTIQKSPQLDVEVVFSNRRFAKLREALKGMSPVEGAAECRKMIDDGLKRSDDTVDRILKSYQDSDAPKNTVSMLGNKWGISAVLLAMGEQCDAKTVVDAIDSAERAEQKWLAVIEASPDTYPPALAPAIASNASLETAFKVNAISLAAFRDPKVPQATKAKLAELLTAMEVKKVQLVSWDASVTPYDVPHTRQGVPVDVSRGAEDINVYHIPASRLNDTVWQRNLLDGVRQTIKAGLSEAKQVE